MQYMDWRNSGRRAPHQRKSICRLGACPQQPRYFDRNDLNENASGCRWEDASILRHKNFTSAGSSSIRRFVLGDCDSKNRWRIAGRRAPRLPRRILYVGSLSADSSRHKRILSKAAADREVRRPLLDGSKLLMRIGKSWGVELAQYVILRFRAWQTSPSATDCCSRGSEGTLGLCRSAVCSRRPKLNV